MKTLLRKMLEGVRKHFGFADDRCNNSNILILQRKVRTPYGSARGNAPLG